MARISFRPAFAFARRRPLAVASAVVVIGLVAWWQFSGDAPHKPSRTQRAPVQPTELQVDLSPQQAASIGVAAAGRGSFQPVRSAVGSIDFNQNRLVQVFTPYQGRIISADANVGDRVLRGQVLFSIDSPDLLQAESTLISAAGVSVLQARTLKRVSENLRGGGGAQKDVDQATSDQQAAEGSLRAARDALRIFGKTDEDADRLIAGRRVDSALVVRSPIDGVVTQRTAAPGLLVQPGNAPAPISVADTSTMWMVANVPENASGDIKVGQPVAVTVDAYPGRRFDGKVLVVGASVDPATRRVMVRSEVANPDGLLRAAMLATFVIETGPAVDSVAVPNAAVVREGDGTMTVWVTTDRRRFIKRPVKTGLSKQGQTQIVEGLQAGETIATDGAIFISNKLLAGATD
jgi:cobalt-zinc-cadmium efflux system membrane fusion protein